MEQIYKNKRVLITGHEGFLGAHLAKELVQLGAKVSAVDIVSKRKNNILTSFCRKQIKTFKCDISNRNKIRKIIEKTKPEFVFHLAAEAIVGEALKVPERTLLSNVQGTWNILECVRESRSIKAVVIASSDKAYGSSKKLPYVEDITPLQGEFPYDASKSCTDIIARMYARSFGLNVCILRCGNIYGPGDYHMSRIVPDAVISAIKNRTFKIRSDGKFIRDYIYITDIVSAYLKAGKTLLRKNIKGEAFNISDQRPMSVKDITFKIFKSCNSDMKKVKILNNVKCEIKAQYLCSEKARKILSWKPVYEIDTGLQETIDWYKKNYE